MSEPEASENLQLMNKYMEKHPSFLHNHTEAVSQNKKLTVEQYFTKKGKEALAAAAAASAASGSKQDTSDVQMATENEPVDQRQYNFNQNHNGDDGPGVQNENNPPSTSGQEQSRPVSRSRHISKSKSTGSMFKLPERDVSISPRLSLTHSESISHLCDLPPQYDLVKNGRQKQKKKA